MKVAYSLAIAAILMALPFLGLLYPSFTYEPRVGPYGSFVSNAGSLLALSRCLAFILALISLVLITRWKSAPIHAAIYVVAALVLVKVGVPIARATETTSRQNVLTFYEGLKPGQEQSAIERKTRETENFSFSPLNLGEHDRLAGFPADDDAKSALIVKSHGTRASVALWFRSSQDDGKLKLARKAFLDNKTLYEMAPPLADEEDRILVGVLSWTDHQLLFMPCHIGSAYPVSTERAPEQAKVLIGNQADQGKRNAILVGRVVDVASRMRVVDVRSWRKIVGSRTYDQSFYDTCDPQLR
ncbi:hypothetical protein ACPPVV_02840 [Rhodanobacter sp. Col0626]|uniref:hypothetical protein n=1 Tax=Rhodanobacter sp. Col0626 TaxID=3415679 RepID=UPI003CE9DACE